MVVLFIVLREAHYDQRVPHFLGLETEPRKVYICQINTLALSHILGPFESLLLFYVETRSVVSWLAVKLMLLWSLLLKYLGIQVCTPKYQKALPEELYQKKSQHVSPLLNLQYYYYLKSYMQ